jgi:hypothetical protein
MQIFTFKRLLGAAAIYGAVRYVRANGGAKAVFDDLSSKARNMVSGAKEKIEEATQNAGGDNRFATNTGRGTRYESEKSPRGSSYASYDLDNDDKLRH